MTELRSRLGETRDLLVIDSSKLDAFSANKLRNKLKEKGITILTVKNTLAKKTLGELGVTAVNSFLSGPSALVFGGPDMVALSREITKWVKDLKVVAIKGGALDGTSLDSAQVESLSKSPGREELIGRVLMLIRSPGGHLAAALQGPGGYVAGQVKSLADKEPTEEQAESATAEAPAPAAAAT